MPTAVSCANMNSRCVLFRQMYKLLRKLYEWVLSEKLLEMPLSAETVLEELVLFYLGDL